VLAGERFLPLVQPADIEGACLTKNLSSKLLYVFELPLREVCNSLLGLQLALQTAAALRADKLLESHCKDIGSFCPLANPIAGVSEREYDVGLYPGLL
jgi:hypothetical protein